MARRQKRSERLQVMLLESELKVVDEWRFDNRIPTRAAAIRELLRLGLIASGYQPEQILEQVQSNDHVPPSDSFGLIKSV